MLLKILLTAGLIYIVYIAFFKKPTIKSSHHNNQKDIDAIDEMVACARCGTYTANDEAIISLGKTYCSKECVKDAK